MTLMPSDQSELRESTHRCKANCPGRCKGSVMLLVMVAVAIASIISLSFLTSSTTTTAIAQMVDDHAQARQIAESGLQLGKSYIERNAAWNLDQENGVWVSEFPLLGGSLSLEATFDASPAVTPIAVSNSSFESGGGGTLSDGFMGLNPDMSGTIQGWQVKRSCLNAIQTSLTVPHPAIGNSAKATEGSKIASVKFLVSVQPAVTFSRTLTGVELEPQTTYRLTADVINVSVAALLPDYSLSVKVGGTTVASATSDQLITLLDLNATSTTQALQFTTGDSPPAGNITLEIGSSMLVGVIQTIGFDNVRFEKQAPQAIMFTATSSYNHASHVVSAMVMPMGNTTNARIMQWSDP